MIQTPEWIYAITGIAFASSVVAIVSQDLNIKLRTRERDTMINLVAHYQHDSYQRLTALNIAIDRNAALSAHIADLRADLATHTEAKERRIAQCRANAAAGGRARAAKRLAAIKAQAGYFA